MKTSMLLQTSFCSYNNISLRKYEEDDWTLVQRLRRPEFGLVNSLQGTMVPWTKKFA